MEVTKELACAGQQFQNNTDQVYSSRNPLWNQSNHFTCHYCQVVLADCSLCRPKGLRLFLVQESAMLPHDLAFQRFSKKFECGLNHTVFGKCAVTVRITLKVRCSCKVSGTLVYIRSHIYVSLNHQCTKEELMTSLNCSDAIWKPDHLMQDECVIGILTEGKSNPWHHWPRYRQYGK